MDGSPDESLPPLPEAYENDAFRAFPRDAKTIHVWWDLHPDTAGEAPLFLRVENASGEEEQMIALEGIVGHRLVEIRDSGTTYALALCHRNGAGAWKPVTPILPVRMPRTTPPDGNPVRVTIAPDA